MKEIIIDDSQKQYPGEIIKETIWSSITHNGQIESPARVADRIVATLRTYGYRIVHESENAK